MKNPVLLILLFCCCWLVPSAPILADVSDDASTVQATRPTRKKASELFQAAVPVRSHAMPGEKSEPDFTVGFYFGALAFLVILSLLVGVWFGFSLLFYYSFFASLIGLFQCIKEGFVFVPFPASDLFHSQNVPMIVWVAGWWSFLRFSARLFSFYGVSILRGIPDWAHLVLAGAAVSLGMFLHAPWLAFLLPILVVAPYFIRELRHLFRHTDAANKSKLGTYLTGAAGLTIIMVSYSFDSAAPHVSNHWRLVGMFFALTAFNLSILAHFRRELQTINRNSPLFLINKVEARATHSVPSDALNPPSILPKQPAGSDSPLNANTYNPTTPNIPKKIALPGGLLLQPDDIAYIEAARHYTHLYYNDRSRGFDRLRLSFTQALENFIPTGFIQTHRGYAVNPASIQRKYAAEIQLTNGLKVPISRTYKAKEPESSLESVGEKS